MRARPILRAVRFAAPTLAIASIAVAGGSVAASARAGGDPCDSEAITTGAQGKTPVPCVEPTTPTTTVEEPPAETPPATPTPPPTGVEPTTPATPTPPPAKPSMDTTAIPSPPPPPSAIAPPAGTGLPVAPQLPAPPDNGLPTLAGGPYVFPVVGPSTLTNSYGAPRADVGWHHGVDIFAPKGAPLVAVADGTLSLVGWNRIGGRRLWLRDRAGNYFYYAHLSRFARIAVNGGHVGAGTIVGYVGNTGDAAGTPYHLHFEVHPVSLLSMGYDGSVDPFPYLSLWPHLDHGVKGISTAALARWRSSAAPTPGAFLLRFTDISSASGLSQRSLQQTLDGRSSTTVAVYEAGQPGMATGTTAALSGADARMARALDSEAARSGNEVGGIWDQLALCESSGDWSANTGNGYIGGLQFLPETWAANGGLEFAPSPQLATPAEQITVAKRVLASQGWGAWPVCSAMLGLRAFGLPRAP